VHAGFIFPADDSYGGDRLTSLRLVYKFEGPRFLIESTALLGLAWGSNTAEWTPLDVFVARTFGQGDLAGYLGGGLGMRVVHVEREFRDELCTPDPYYDCIDYHDETATALSADIGGGLMAFRTYSYQLVVGLRYHYVFEDFDELGGHGAHGFALSFGTTH
jgi:hypothetical protein